MRLGLHGDRFIAPGETRLMRGPLWFDQEKAITSELARLSQLF
jgi:hypothetical protein